jgi:hypothetical protein
MRVLKPSWAPERTTLKLQREAVAQTTRGLGGSAKATSGDAPSRAEQRWIALVKQGLVDLDTVPTIVTRPEEASSVRCDEVELYVVRRVESGATMRALMEGGQYATDVVLRAMARLTHHGLLQLI